MSWTWASSINLNLGEVRVLELKIVDFIYSLFIIIIYDYYRSLSQLHYVTLSHIITQSHRKI